MLVLPLAKAILLGKTSICCTLDKENSLVSWTDCIQRHKDSQPTTTVEKLVVVVVVVESKRVCSSSPSAVGVCVGAIACLPARSPCRESQERCEPRAGGKGKQKAKRAWKKKNEAALMTQGKAGAASALCRRCACVRAWVCVRPPLQYAEKSSPAARCSRSSPVL